MVMKAGDLVSLSFGQLLVSHGVPLCFFGEKKRTRTGSWPLLSYAPWVLQLLSEFATIYLLHEGSIDTKKLSALLNEEKFERDDTEASNFFTKGDFIGKYQVLSVSDEIIELLKPNGSHLPLALSLITELAEYVKNGEITLDDIRDAKVFDKVVNSQLERYLVNGYNNILPELVKRLITPSKNETKKSLWKVRTSP